MYIERDYIHSDMLVRVTELESNSFSIFTNDDDFINVQYILSLLRFVCSY